MSLWQDVQRALGRSPGCCLSEAGLKQRVWTGPELLGLAQAAARLLRASPGVKASSAGQPRICAFYLTNSAAYVVAVLAALRLGLAFLPLDPGWPPHRLQQVCDEARPLAVLWSAPAASCGGRGRPAVSGVPLVELPALAALLEGLVAGGLQQEEQRGQQEQGEQRQQEQQSKHMQQSEEGQQDEPSPKASSCCYVLYTSGSTGRPLGVLGTEAGVLNRCRWMQQAIPFQAGDRVAFKTSPCFVDGVWELFGPLLGGACLVAVPQATMRDPAQLLACLAQQGITHLAAVPTLWRALSVAMRRQPATADALKLRLAVSSGEPLQPEALGELQALLPAGCVVWNLYGSTEVAADCTAFDCTRWRSPAAAGQQQQQEQQGQQATASRRLEQQPGEQQQGQQQVLRQVPVGRPISGMLVAVLGPQEPGSQEPDSGQEGSHGSSDDPQAWQPASLDVLPAGQIRLVAVGGAGLAAGYLCRHPAAAAAQQQRFIQLAARQLQQALGDGSSAAVAAGEGLPAGFWQQSEVRLFLTGDLGWLDREGCLHLAGRRDHQVKLSGVRVDLAEVEAALCQHPSVAAAAAKVWQLPAGPVLAAYAELESSTAGSQTLPGQEETAASLLDFCRQRLPAAAVPRHVQVLDRLPRSAAGKVQRSELPPLPSVEASGAAARVAGQQQQQGKEEEEEAADGQRQAAKRQRTAGAAAAPASASSPASSQPASELAVSRAFAAALGHSDFEATTNLFAAGGNSLAAAQIAGEVAGGRVEAVFEHPTVRSLAAYLNSLAAAAAGQSGQVQAQQAAGGGGQEQQPEAAAGGGVGSGGLPGGQQQQRAPAVCFTARRLHVGQSGSEGEAQQQQLGGGMPAGRLRLAWRGRMLQCVDAAPVLVLAAAESEEPAAADGIDAPAQQQQQQQQGSMRVFACSHGGDVRCWDVGSGRQLWQTVLPDRTDAGLVLCRTSASLPVQPGQQQQEGGEQQQQDASHVAVGTNGGTLFFLDASTGGISGSVAASGGGIRAPPACDPWLGLVWQPTHGRELLVAAATGREAARLALPAAASAGVTFDAARRLAFVCCLDGSLLAVTVAGNGSQASSNGSSQDVTGSAWQLRVAWQWRCSAPLFAPAALTGGGCVVVAAVEGSITALRCSDGSQAWQASVQGAVFAPMLLLPAASRRPGQLQQEQVLLIGTQSGQLAALDAGSGSQLAAVELGAKVTGMQCFTLPPLPAADAGEQGQRQQQGERAGRRLAAVCLAQGVLVLLDLAAFLSGSADSTAAGKGGKSGSSCVLDAVQLPADVFAAPAAGCDGSGGCWVAVGCRDDHLYCLSLERSE